MTNELIERPSFLLPADPSKTGGMELMGEYCSPSFLKVIQPLAKAPFKPPFIEGDVVAVPNMERIITREEIFHFVPIFFYPEFCIHNPIQVQGLSFIRERTLDTRSEIAKKCKSKDEDVREFDCPENPKFNCTFVEHLNFVIVLLDNNSALGDTPIVISLFKSEWRKGVNFIALTRARKAEHICGCRFQASVSLRQNSKGQWYGLDICNPEDGQSWVTDQKMYQAFVAMHSQFQKNYDASELQVEYDAAPEVESTENRF